jgi:putative spermidine/putrescine transport system substrate-binding protein
LGALLGAILVALPLGVQAQELKSESRVVVGIFGGLLGQRLRATVESYTKANGIEAVFVEGTGNDLLAKARAQKASPQMDLFVCNDVTFQLAKSLDLLAKVDEKLAPNLTKVRPEWRDKDGYGQNYEINPVGLVYRTDKFDEAKLGKPTSFLVFLEPGLKGRGILFPPTVSYGFHTIIALAIAGGKDESDASPAWAIFEKIRANDPIVSQTPGQAETAAGRGEGWIYVSSAERAHLLAKQGSPIGFAIAKEGAIALPNCIAPTKGAKNPIAAMRVLNHMIGKDVQTQMANESAVAPVNSEVELPGPLKQRLGFDPDKPLPALRPTDVVAVSRQLDDWVERFNRLFSR